MPVTTGIDLPTSALLFGLSASGKSSYIASQVLAKIAAKPDTRVVWLSLDNTAAFEDKPELLDKVDLGVYSTWEDFKKDANKIVALPLKDQYSIVVVDGLSALRRIAISSMSKNPQPSVPEWGQMSKEVHELIRRMKDASTHFYASALLAHENVAAQGATPNMQTFFDLNNDLIKRFIPEFNKKLYAYVQPRADTEGKIIGTEHLVQHNPAAALRFSQLQFG